MKITSKLCKGVSWESTVIGDWCCRGEKIQLIKAFREFTNQGLKDSKDFVERYQTASQATPTKDGYTRWVFDYNKMWEDVTTLYSNEHYDPMTKDEFLALIGHAIDVADTLCFPDMLTCAETLLANIKASGGLDAIAKKRAQFINNL